MLVFHDPGKEFEKVLWGEPVCVCYIYCSCASAPRGKPNKSKTDPAFRQLLLWFKKQTYLPENQDSTTLMEYSVCSVQWKCVTYNGS